MSGPKRQELHLAAISSSWCLNAKETPRRDLLACLVTATRAVCRSWRLFESLQKAVRTPERNELSATRSRRRYNHYLATLQHVAGRMYLFVVAILKALVFEWIGSFPSE